MAKKRSAKIIMQQRKNFADAKSKIVGHVKENYIEPFKVDPNKPKKPKAPFGSWEGSVSTYLGMAPSQNEDIPKVQTVPDARDKHFETGSTEHLPKNVISMEDFKDKKLNSKPEGY